MSLIQGALGDAPACIPMWRSSKDHSWPLLLLRFGFSVCFFCFVDPICPSQAVWWIWEHQTHVTHQLVHLFLGMLGLSCNTWHIVTHSPITQKVDSPVCITFVHLLEGSWLMQKVQPWKHHVVHSFSSSLTGSFLRHGHPMHIKLLGHHTAGVHVAWNTFVLDKEKRADLEALAWSSWHQMCLKPSYKRKSMRGLTHLKKKKNFLKIFKLVGKIICY